MDQATTPVIGLAKHTVRLADILGFCFPTSLIHPNAAARLFLFAEYGPLKNHHSFICCLCEDCQAIARARQWHEALPCFLRRQWQPHHSALPGNRRMSKWLIAIRQKYDALREYEQQHTRWLQLCAKELLAKLHTFASKQARQAARAKGLRGNDTVRVRLPQVEVLESMLDQCQQSFADVSQPQSRTTLRRIVARGDLIVSSGTSAKTPDITDEMKDPADDADDTKDDSGAPTHTDIAAATLAPSSSPPTPATATSPYVPVEQLPWLCKRCAEHCRTQLHLTAGLRGRHIVSELQMGEMERDLVKDDILQAFKRKHQMTDKEEREFLSSLPQSKTNFKPLSRAAIKRLLKDVPRNADGSMDFQAVKRTIHAVRKKRIHDKAQMYPPVEPQPVPKVKYVSPNLAAPLLKRKGGVPDSQSFTVTSRLLHANTYHIATLKTKSSPELNYNVYLMRDLQPDSETNWKRVA